MIGFNYNGKNAVEKAEQEELLPTGEHLTAEQLIKIRGLEMAWKAVHEYLDSSKFPLIRDNKRDQWIAERLRKIKDRYFDTI